MHRSARLLQLLDRLRRASSAQTGPELARQFGVSLRTLYHDVATLREQGAAIDGEPGTGYTLRPGFLMLEECGALYVAVQLAYESAMKSPEFLKLNPMDKVPCLVHGDTVITESGAILATLADLYPNRQLAPAVGSAERGSYPLAFLRRRSIGGRDDGQRTGLFEGPDTQAGADSGLRPL